MFFTFYFTKTGVLGCNPRKRLLILHCCRRVSRFHYICGEQNQSFLSPPFPSTKTGVRGYCLRKIVWILYCYLEENHCQSGNSRGIQVQVRINWMKQKSDTIYVIVYMKQKSGTINYSFEYSIQTINNSTEHNFHNGEDRQIDQSNKNLQILLNSFIFTIQV